MSSVQLERQETRVQYLQFTMPQQVDGLAIYHTNSAVLCLQVFQAGCEALQHGKFTMILARSQFIR